MEVFHLKLRDRSKRRREAWKGGQGRRVSALTDQLASEAEGWGETRPNSGDATAKRIRGKFNLPNGSARRLLRYELRFKSVKKARNANLAPKNTESRTQFRKNLPDGVWSRGET